MCSPVAAMRGGPERGMAVPVTMSTGEDTAGDAAGLYLLCRIDGRPYALPAAAVERILPLAAPMALPDAPPGVLGALDYRGALLAVVDPRPHLGSPVAPLAPEQHLVVLAARTRYLLRVDRVERIVALAAERVAALASPADRPLLSAVARLDGEPVPVLAPDALDPGPLVRGREDGRR